MCGRYVQWAYVFIQDSQNYPLPTLRFYLTVWRKFSPWLRVKIWEWPRDKDSFGEAQKKQDSINLWTICRTLGWVLIIGFDYIAILGSLLLGTCKQLCPWRRGQRVWRLRRIWWWKWWCPFQILTGRYSCCGMFMNKPLLILSLLPLLFCIWGSLSYLRTFRWQLTPRIITLKYN